jgi:hypothetical protein
MKYRQINTNFWEDSYVLSLTNLERLFFLYLFLNPKVNMCGIYELADKTIRYTLDLTLEEIKILRLKFEKDKKFYFYKEWVFISKYSTHNKYSSAKPIVSAFIKEFNTIPNDIRYYFLVKLNLFYELPILNSEVILDKVIDKDKDKGVGVRVAPRVGMRLNEDVNPDDIPL